MWTRNPAVARWTRFALRRAAGFLLGAVLLVVGAFLLIHLIGGDPVRASLGIEASPELAEARRADLHLDEPLWKQFGYYVADLTRLDFGVSIKTGEPVSRIIGARMPNTVELAAVSIGIVLVLSVVVGVVVGALTSDGRRPGLEVGFGGVTGTVIAVPEFLLATLLVFLFGVSWELLPVAGKSGVSSFVLPAAALALPPTAFLARVVRVETVKVLSTDYMRTARSKQLPRRLFYVRHALPNLLTSALTLGGLIFGALLGGSVIVENIFAWPGLGTAVVAAILDRDYPLVQAVVLILGLLVLLVNTLVDVILAILDPRSVVAEH